jgi:hypothetical protein
MAGFAIVDLGLKVALGNARGSLFIRCARCRAESNRKDCNLQQRS